MKRTGKATATFVNERPLSAMEKQGKEFDAVGALVEHHRRLSMTAIVDDDYPEVRYAYEGALHGLITGMKVNGRFEPGNRYGIDDGKIFRGLRDLCGYVENGSSVTVKLFQDDATREWFCTVDQRFFHAPSFKGAIEAAIKGTPA